MRGDVNFEAFTGYDLNYLCKSNIVILDIVVSVEVDIVKS